MSAWGASGVPSRGCSWGMDIFYKKIMGRTNAIIYEK